VYKRQAEAPAAAAPVPAVPAATPAAEAPTTPIEVQAEPEVVSASDTTSDSETPASDAVTDVSDEPEAEPVAEEKPAKATKSRKADVPDAERYGESILREFGAKPLDNPSGGR
jgi:hypothetical protein